MSRWPARSLCPLPTMTCCGSSVSGITCLSVGLDPGFTEEPRGRGAPGRGLAEGRCLLPISKMPVAKCNNLHNRLLVLLKGMILSGQFSNARWAVSFGRYKEININKKRATWGSLEPGGIQQATCRCVCQKPLWGQSQPGTSVCSFSIYWGGHLSLAQHWLVPL